MTGLHGEHAEIDAAPRLRDLPADRAADIEQRLERLLPRWRERALAADRSARLPLETLGELHDSGLLHLLTPRRYGGLQQDFPRFVEIARRAATACASTAWMLCVVGGHASTAARLPKSQQDIVFADGPRQLFATAAVQVGSFVRDGDGFRLDGVWRYSSGIDHASWVILTARLGEADARDASTLYKVMLRREDVQALDSWQVAGMRATGSKDLLFDRLRVPAEWVFERSRYFGAHPPGAELHPEAYLYDVPLIPYSTSWIVGPILGCAQGAYQHCLEALRERGRRGDAVLAAHLARSDAELSCARHLYHALLDTLHAAGVARRALSTAETLRIRRDRAYLAQLCVEAIRRLIGSMGTAAAFDSHPAQRHWRDLQVMASHVDVAWDAASTAYGNHEIAGE